MLTFDTIQGALDFLQSRVKAWRWLRSTFVALGQSDRRYLRYLTDLSLMTKRTFKKKRAVGYILDIGRRF
jgi:hypothetical protein